MQHVVLRATWYEGTAQLLSLTEFKLHLFQLYFIGWTIKPMKDSAPVLQLLAFVFTHQHHTERWLPPDWPPHQTNRWIRLFTSTVLPPTPCIQEHSIQPVSESATDLLWPGNVQNNVHKKLRPTYWQEAMTKQQQQQQQQETSPSSSSSSSSSAFPSYISLGFIILGEMFAYVTVF